MCWLTDTPVCGIINYFFKSSTYFKAIVWYVVKKQILHLTLHLNSSYIAVPWGDRVPTYISSSCRVKREKKIYGWNFLECPFPSLRWGPFFQGGSKKDALLKRKTEIYKNDSVTQIYGMKEQARVLCRLSLNVFSSCTIFLNPDKKITTDGSGYNGAFASSIQLLNPSIMFLRSALLYDEMLFMGDILFELNGLLT